MDPDYLIAFAGIRSFGRIERHGDIDDFKWVSEGAPNVRRALDIVRPWLGDVKVKQALEALASHEQVRLRGGPDFCIRGHQYDYVYIRPNGAIHRRCRACGHLRAQATRMELPMRPRRLEDAPTRYA